MRHISELYSIHGGRLKKHIIIHPDSDSDESDSDVEGNGLGGGLYAGGGGLYAGRGGKLNLKKAFNDAGKYITKKKGGLASALVNYGIPAVTGALGGAAGELIAPEGGPVSALVGSQLGALGGRYAARAINKSAGTGMMLRGRPRKSMSAGDTLAVPRGVPPATLSGMSGGKLKQDLIKTYNKVVPKSMQPAVNNLAGQVGNYALDKAGYSGNPIPTGKGIRKGRMVKGSPEALAWAEKMRQSRMK